QRAHQVTHTLPPERRRDDQRGDLVGQIAQRLGLHRRSVNRYLRVLRAPQSIQEAFAAGKLRLTAAEKVVDLPTGVREAIVSALEAGQDAPEVMARTLSVRGWPPQKGVVGL